MIDEYYKFVEDEQEEELSSKKSFHNKDWEGWPTLFLAKKIDEAADYLVEFLEDLR